MANNVPAVYEKIKNDRLHFPPDVAISQELRDLINQMLEKDPNKRITLPMMKVSFVRIMFSKMSFYL